MNRQVGPSIVLSVLIVCFFAVALFQHDPPRSAHNRGRAGLADRSAPSRAAPAPGPSHAPTVQTAAADTPKPSSARPYSPSRPVDWGGDSSIPRVAPAEAGSVVRASARSAVSDGAKRPARTESVRQPGSEFTVALANETIEDVAFRVYGSTDQAESLWRANRDSLPRRESPLATGVVLRTPTIR
jgi:hypothetical protein